MKRFISSDLLNWKNNKYRKPLVVEGVRQVGKTWILKEFGKEFDNLAYFNFEENPLLNQFFENKKMYMKLLKN